MIQQSPPPAAFICLHQPSSTQLPPTPQYSGLALNPGQASQATAEPLTSSPSSHVSRPTRDASSRGHKQRHKHVVSTARGRRLFGRGVHPVPGGDRSVLLVSPGDVLAVGPGQCDQPTLPQHHNRHAEPPASLVTASHRPTKWSWKFRLFKGCEKDEN